MSKIPDYVRGVIYIATCTHPEAEGKAYVGQTRTHMLNHGSYIRYGAKARWAAHVSEAVRNRKFRQCWKLNNAIRKYGAEYWVVETLVECDLQELDELEKAFIRQHNSVEGGYNLQGGGRAGEGKNSEEARAAVAETLKRVNDAQRLEKHKGAIIIGVNFVRLEDKGVRVFVKEASGRVTYTSFYGLRSTLTESARRAIAFARGLPGGAQLRLRFPDSIREEMTRALQEHETARLREDAAMDELISELLDSL